MDYLEDVPEDRIFYLGDKKIKNLYGLLFEFREMDDAMYSGYASDDHNYFADWVLHVIEDRELAEKLRAAKSRKDEIGILETAIEDIRKAEHPAEEKKKEIEFKLELVNDEPDDKTEEENIQKTVKNESVFKPAEHKDEPVRKMENLTDDKDAKLFLWKHFGWEMAKEFMYGLAFGILIGLILAKMFFR